MCGIAGIIDLAGQRSPEPGRLRNMAAAIVHRGPDEDGFFDTPGLAFANRRLSIVGLADGRQPIFNEDRSIATVFNGEFFDYPSLKQQLEGRGHRFATHCDTELIPHLYEDYQEGMLDHLEGQFGIAMWDSRRRRVILARDRFGICPMYYTRVRWDGTDWMIFGSEIKAILASGMVEAKPDPLGINHLFTFIGMPGPQTCFKGIRALEPGHFLDIHLGQSPRVEDRLYWRMDFPTQGEEVRGPDLKTLVDGLEHELLTSVEKRLRADVPVVSYLSGGVDSSVVVAMASRIRGNPIPSFTIRIKAPKLDETAEATVVAKHIGTTPIVVDVGAEEVLNTYPTLIRAAEAPVVDTSCAALLLLAKEVNKHGYKVALTGEGSDEWMAGYPWHKVHRVASWFDQIPGLKVSQWMRRFFMWITRSPRHNQELQKRAISAIGGYNGWMDFYNLFSLSKLRLFSADMLSQVRDHSPFEDMNFPTEQMRKWHPLNRELYMSGRCHLAGLLINAKGDRVAMNSSVETRYPFLDVNVFNYLAKLHPKWKFRGLRDKYILRHLADRYLPSSISWRKKAMFRAPFDSFHLDKVPPFVDQLLSQESLLKTGYFDAAQVKHWRTGFKKLPSWSLARISIEMGLVGVLATQLWHQTYIDSSLADLPAWDGANGSQKVNIFPTKVNA
ncbi:MAG: asparagine synthase (glutamine-hydrolyzing) [Gemmataceae bacterium]|nr:asparagine synthase (glutamine-hydrolyzing) [Gemmataceae bacterium]